MVNLLIEFLLFGVNEKLLTQHISGPVTKYKLLYVSNQGRAGARAWLGLRVRARARHCHLLSKISGPFTRKTNQFSLKKVLGDVNG